MGLTIRQSTGFKRPLTIRDKFTVTVNHRTRTEQEQFIESLINVDRDEAAKRCAEYFLVAAESDGLTISTAHKLGVAVADDQATDEEGFIAIDAGVLADVWRHAYADRFADPITTFSRDMLSTIDREKEAAKNV